MYKNLVEQSKICLNKKYLLFLKGIKNKTHPNKQKNYVTVLKFPTSFFCVKMHFKQFRPLIYENKAKTLLSEGETTPFMAVRDWGRIPRGNKRPQGRRCEFFIICVYLCNICERVSKNRDVTMDTFRPVKIFVFQKDRNDFCENWRSYFRGILIVQYSCLFVMTC